MVPVKLNGKWDLILPAHRAERAEWTNPPYWEFERLNHMAANIRPSDTVIDVGAEEGDISAICAKLAFRGGVVLIECNPRVWPNIRAIWAENHLRDPLAYWVGFASDTTVDSPDRLDIDQANAEGWPICAYGPVIRDHGFRVLAEQADSTPQITLDELMARNHLRPDVITIDVEGAELRVLRGAEQTLRLARPIVYCSIHPQFMIDTYQQDASDLHEHMINLGYREELLAIDHEEHWVFSHPYGRRLWDK